MIDRKGAPERGVIVVGAGEDRRRFANKAVRAYLEAGYRVFPVHPTATACEGLPVAPSVSALSESAELLLLYVRPEVGLAVVREAVARGVRRIYLNPGTESEELVREIERLGMEPIEACAIVALGRSPSEFAE
ncbi:MAG: CoA-binding protein [Candidatus Eisenbacteria bacterium]|nr:CoA-binding protein [Candidatus Eisenbacteria bacterium]MCC7144421.1 CoA-binding protein [Candidatus Eisenbacteria bacterium]